MITAPIDSSWTVRAKAISPVIVLAAWTLAVWVGRIRNIAADAELTGVDRGWRLALAAAFVALGAASAAAIVRFACWGRARSYGVARRLGIVLAWFGIVVWPIRAITILLASFGVGFKVVHTVLAAATIGLGALVLRWGASTR